MGVQKFLKKHPLNEDMALQITSMADIFTIILVFLLKSFSTSVTSISPSNDVVLPSALNSDEVVDSMKLEISPSVILIDDKPITTMREFRFEASDVERDGTARSLNSTLIRERKKRPEKDAEGKPVNPSQILVLADQKTPYATLKAVLNSASSSGFTEFKLVVVKDE